ncbi:YhcN/YlaJ family sporulation lipoprotein [Tumebacillus permanentifrigoris]|uniref:YhcN/YlaJ family sporulation lipoprotein n=1 Tax=Tumebacillus permanentifrigoris TaxID=378543 RepID=A0A316DBZ4_9BACL|nr:YhcN/YlaJ family sporulation lipoprotein [Tumebacillus permanentifrigoris]PWK14426.1 YhcN/YlaJ family sporulation lipoprotein [Tumebacillus permanentifrigoris]
MKSSRMLTVALSVVLAMTLTGCTQKMIPQALNKNSADNKRTAEGVQQREATEKTTPAEQNPDRSQVSEIHKPNYSLRAPKIASLNPKNADATLTKQADEIANVATRIQGVERAAVFLTGKTALVGIDLADNISGSKIDTIKFSVKEAAERTGKGYRAIVSSDIDTVTRARALVNDVRNGKPISGISDEIADIVSRLLPEM